MARLQTAISLGPAVFFDNEILEMRMNVTALVEP
jgi:hypothetical protein